MGEIYLELIKTGNVLFKNWTATIYCDEEYQNTMKVNFGLSDPDKNQSIFAIRKYEIKTVDSINKTVKFLQNCHNEWLNHLNTKRDSYNELNYFRIDQIVFLRTELALFAKNNLFKDYDDDEFNMDENEYNPKVLFDLLYNINRSLTVETLSLANKYAFELQHKNLKTKALEKESLLDEFEKSDLLKELMSDYGFSKNLVMQAKKALNTDDKDKLLNYCFEKSLDDTEETNEPKEEVYVDRSDLNILNFDQLKLEVFGDSCDPYESENDDSLDSKFKKVWEKFKDYLDSNFEDFVSLNHLGLVLSYLKSKSEFVIHREKAPFLEINTPNLIICPQDEIIKRALGLYMVSPEQPLPTDDELLYCNSDTTHEQIELFWKRVLASSATDKSQKIYCLINVQDLSYDQAVKAQVCFEKLLANSEIKEFVLCIFCSAEKEDKSVFVTAFNRHRKNIPMDKSIDEDLNNYLAKNFKYANESERNSLHNIDKDNLNVRIITSDKPGTGKSLYIKRSIERARNDVNANIKHCCVSIKKQTLPFEEVFKQLKNFESDLIAKQNTLPKIFHIDIAYEVWYEVDYFLFNLLCIGSLQNKNGQLFRRDPKDLYLIEIMSPKFKTKNDHQSMDDGSNNENMKLLHNSLNILPKLFCQTPVETLAYITQAKELPSHICPILFDDETLKSDLIQRPCQYLQALEVLRNFDGFQFSPNKFLNVKTCLELLIRHLENKSPSWSEIINFSRFLNTQLIDSEKSAFCDPALAGDTLPGFKTFVVKFMIQMSHDFALPSLNISDRSALQIKSNNKVEFQIEQLVS